jgi:formate dehydrogenase major subunit
MDIKNADVVFVMGGNPAENHPCGFKWALQARKERGAKILCVDPRFNRTAAVSDLFLQIRPGADLAFMGGLIRYVLQHKKYHEEYVRHFTNATYLITETYSFDPSTGLFSGYDAEKRKYDQGLWGYQKDPQGFVRRDPSMENPRCVFQLLKQHYARYTPETVEKITGIKKEEFLEVAAIIAETGKPDRSMSHLYALGWTHHSFGVQLIGSMAILQLLLGNIGVPGGAVNALRGHANVQGLTDLGGEGRFLPGYLKPPLADQQTLKDHLAPNTPKPLTPHSMNYWSNYPKFYVSLLKAWYGPAATPKNEFAYHYLPKMRATNSWDVIVDNMYKGKMEGGVWIAVNLLSNTPCVKKTVRGLAKLKWAVIVDPFKVETAEFWEAVEGMNPEEVPTEIVLLPGAIFAEKDASYTNSGRTIKWKWKALDPPGEGGDERWILANLFLRIGDLYRKEGGKFPEPILHLTWNYKNPRHPAAEELLAEMNGSALEDLKDEKGNVVVKKGDRVPGFAALKEDGSTACGMWLYSGVYPPAGNRAASTSLEDPSGLGVYLGYGFAWPANRRILYNRASADPSGKPWSPKKRYLWWNEAEGKWAGFDIPDIKPDLPPATGPFIMLPEGTGRLFAPQLVDGPFPEHYEPFESPIANPLHPRTNNNPVVKVYKSELDLLGTPDAFPYVATTYRITEHYHFWTKHLYGPSHLFAHMFVEIPEELAREKGIRNGDRVRVTGARGAVEGLVLVTKRIKPLIVDGKKVFTVGIPIHWGYEGIVKGALVNLITPFIWDPNCQTPEYKGFLCNIEKIREWGQPHAPSGREKIKEV